MPFPSYSRGRIVRRSLQHVRGRGGGAPRPPPPKSFLPPLADELSQGAAVAEPQSAAPMPPSSSSGTQSLSTRRPSARALRRSSYRLRAAGERLSTDEESSTDDDWQGLRLHPSSPEDDFEALLPAANVSPASASVSLTPPAEITQPPSSRRRLRKGRVPTWHRLLRQFPLRLPLQIPLNLETTSGTVTTLVDTTCRTPGRRRRPGRTSSRGVESPHQRTTAALAT